MALAQPKEIADAVARYRANVSRQRLDFRQTPGLMHAVLTVALPNGQTMRFVGTVSMDAMRDAYVRANPSVGKDLADSFKENFMGTHTGAALKTKFLETAHKLWSQNAVLPNTRAMGARGNKPVRDSFSSFNAFWSWYIHLPIKETTHMGSLKHAWKSIKKMAKTVATSKVFQAAAIGLAIVAPMLGGPLAAAAVAAGGAMTVARKLYAAKQHLAKGNVSAARALIASAKKPAAKMKGRRWRWSG